MGCCFPCFRGDYTTIDNEAAKEEHRKLLENAKTAVSKEASIFKGLSGKE